MRTHWYVLLVLPAGLLGLLGCRTPQIVSQLERENSALENKIWELVALLEQKQSELEACRAELARLKGEPRVRGGQTPEPTRDTSSSAAPLWMGSPGGQFVPAPHVANSGEAATDSPRRLIAPRVEVVPPQKETSPERALPLPQGSGGSEEKDDSAVHPPLFLTPEGSGRSSAPEILPREPRGEATLLPGSSPNDWEAGLPSPRVGSPLDSTEPAATAKNSETEPERILLSPQTVVGRNYDGEPGDDGIALLVQPVDRAGHILLRPGKITVVAIDPALPGPAARFARWELQPDEVRTFAIDRADVTGFLLELPWPESPPEHQELKVFVRYETDSGQRLETQADVRVKLPPPH